MSYFVVPVVYAASALGHLLLPGKEVSGYACDCETGKPLKYRLNGLLTLLVVAGGWLILGKVFGLYALSAAAKNFGKSALVAFIFGILGSTALFVKGTNLPQNKRQPYLRCPTKDKPGKKKPSEAEIKNDEEMHWIRHFYHGQEFNPRYGMFDLKMFLYIVGAVMLWINVASVAFWQKEELGHFSNATKVHCWLFTHFVVEYLFFEEVHLYTYDLFAEKIGFKLFWGCFTFYPFFYALGSLYLITAEEIDISAAKSAQILLLFYCGWILTRGSNLQKFSLKKDPSSKSFFFGMIEQRTIPGTHIIVSGFWGLARHGNYFGELVQALAIALPPSLVSGSLVPMLYPLYYFALFYGRLHDDDELCAQKYGPKWDEYRRAVPYKMIPFIW